MKTLTLIVVLAATLTTGCSTFKIHDDGRPGTSGSELSLNALYWTAMILTAKGIYDITYDGQEHNK